jgi:hypothetical protein
MEMNNSPKYLHKTIICELCDYKCSDDNQFSNHINETEHLKRRNGNKMEMDNSPKKFIKKIICEKCNYICRKESEYIKHVNSQKHKNEINILNENLDLKCIRCNKKYKTNSGLWKHNKLCIYDNFNESINENIVIKDASANEIKVLSNIVLELVKSNNDLQKQVLDVCKNMQPSINNNNNTNNNTNINSNNKTFNLNFFLNEQCKDAMNINDFVKSIKIEISDLERLGKEGYVEGFSRIILERLKEMDIYKRPLHCSDAKRETMYIKENNVWNKDESPNNEKMIEFIKAVEQRNYTSLLAYADEYPEVYKQESKRNVPYLHMALQSNGTAERINKVMKRIIKEVVINKDN